MKIEDVRKMNKQDLRKHLVSAREDLKKFRFGIAGSKIRNMKEGKNLKHDIARYLTVLNERLHNN